MTQGRNALSQIRDCLQNRKAMLQAAVICRNPRQKLRIVDRNSRANNGRPFEASVVHTQVQCYA